MANGVDGLPAAMAAAFSSFTNYFTLQTAYASIPIYDGQKPELRDFIRSIETAYSIVPGIDQKTFVAGLMTKFQVVRGTQSKPGRRLIPLRHLQNIFARILLMRVTQFNFTSAKCNLLR